MQWNFTLHYIVPNSQNGLSSHYHLLSFCFLLLLSLTIHEAIVHNSIWGLDGYLTYQLHLMSSLIQSTTNSCPSLSKYPRSPVNNQDPRNSFRLHKEYDLLKHSTWIKTSTNNFLRIRRCVVIRKSIRI